MGTKKLYLTCRVASNPILPATASRKRAASNNKIYYQKRIQGFQGGGPISNFGIFFSPFLDIFHNKSANAYFVNTQQYVTKSHIYLFPTEIRWTCIYTWFWEIYKNCIVVSNAQFKKLIKYLRFGETHFSPNLKLNKKSFLHLIRLRDHVTFFYGTRGGSDP